ncbi:hypothetical protein B0T22DRAFT_439966 [Podospora appendiculata]|uniref:Uncharacterized protein n=1 Tax=Podospora appendiculata TaxID=314037 RepID=A0AAE0X9D5_9PEZI|nr:hypothetical protein B0T22DRAFT_439966 [Podospora appendiculata]
MSVIRAHLLATATLALLSYTLEDKVPGKPQCRSRRKVDAGVDIELQSHDLGTNAYNIQDIRFSLMLGVECFYKSVLPDLAELGIPVWQAGKAMGDRNGEIEYQNKQCKRRERQLLFMPSL